MRQDEKKRKKFQARLPFTLDPGMKIPKKIAKKLKKLKNPFQHYFQPEWDKIGGERGKKKIQTRIPFIIDPGKKIPKKI